MKKIVVQRSPFLPPLSEDQLLAKMRVSKHIDHANGNNPKIFVKDQSTAIRALFTISVIKEYFTVNSGTYTAIAPAALNAGLQVPLPYFMFGHSDYHGGYKGLIGQLPVSTTNWTIGEPFIYGKDASTIEIAIDSTVKAKLVRGDMVIPFTSALPGTGTTTLALVIVRSSTVSYGTLLNALSSDIFAINKIRYTVPSTGATDLAQYDNDILLFTQSLFGKLESDNYPPTAARSPENQQANILDIMFEGEVINKARALGGYINYNVLNFVWNISVGYFDKFQQGANVALPSA